MIQQLILPESLRRRMDAHARAAYPNECCGLLMGTKLGVIVEAVPTANTIRKTHARRAFAVPLYSVLAVRHLIKGLRGLRLLGFYHSHPNTPAVPSPDDKTLAWPRHIYLIARVNRGADVRPWRAWAMDDETPAEIPVAVIP
jgi:proteasome lid subunit RPN8/RPN11